MALELIDAQEPRLTFNSASFAKDASVKKLQRETADIIKAILKQLDDIPRQMLGSPTVKEFSKVRDKAFRVYMNLSMAMGNIVTANINTEETVRITQDALTMTQRKLKLEGSKYLGDDALQEVLFSINALIGAIRWIPTLMSVDASDDSQDKELAHKFLLATTYTHFHLDCLELAIRENISIENDILQKLLEGIRFSVMAYSCVRSALELRNINRDRYREKLDVVWDEEDDLLSKAN